MKTLGKVIFALCVSLFFIAPPVMAQTNSSPEIKQIIKAAKSYAERYGGTEDQFDFKFIKRVGDYALVRDYPKPNIQSEGAGIIIKKVGGKWVGQYIGSDTVEMEGICPELFK